MIGIGEIIANYKAFRRKAEAWDSLRCEIRMYKAAYFEDYYKDHKPDDLSTYRAYDRVDRLMDSFELVHGIQDDESEE